MTADDARSDRVEDAGGDPLEELVFEALERQAQGGPAALEEFLRGRPQEQELRVELERLARVGLLGGAENGGCDTFPERLGDFRLIERIGEGGMGVIYLAEQLSLARTVALKLVRPEQVFFAGTRERFRREIEAVARLQHPGILPVYSVGEEGGIPFFAMERFDGCTLLDVLRRLQGRDPAGLVAADLARTLEQAAPARDGAAPVGGALFEG